MGLEAVGSATLSELEALVSVDTPADELEDASVSLDRHCDNAKIAKAMAMRVKVTRLLFDFIKILLGFVVSDVFSVSLSV